MGAPGILPSLPVSGPASDCMRRITHGLAPVRSPPPSPVCLSPPSVPLLLGGQSVSSAVARSWLAPKSRRLGLWLLGLLAATACLTPSSAPAAAHPQAAFPLPESEYGVREVCPPPSPGHFSCLSLELKPRSAAARAHTRPLGRPIRPQATVASAAEVCEHPTAAEGCYGLRPQDLHSAYELPTSASSEQTIAVVDAYNDPNIEADLSVYDEAFGLPACNHENGCFTKVNQEGASGPLPEAEGGWAVEISLDVETAHAVCQSCRILLVEANNNGPNALGAAENTAVALGADEVTNSWGAPEEYAPGPRPPVPESALKHPGVVITAAAGDDGYDNWLVEPNLADRGNYPAAFPFVVGVGGTRLELMANGARASEPVWNGHGASGSGCSYSYEAPRWQQEVPDWPVGCEHRRAVADVSADADPYTGVAVYDSYSLVERTGGHKEPFKWGTVGGTSLGSPLIAATFALAGGAGGVEYPAESLYERVLSETNHLHQVVSGSNGECSSYDHETGLANCSFGEEAKSCGGQPLCLAGAGYNGPGGLGTPEGTGAFQAAPAPLRAEQTVRITSTPSSPPTVDGPVYEPQANASTGLPVTFALSRQSVGREVCTVEGSDVSFHTKGECPLEARQVGNSKYRAATEVQHLQVLGITQTIKFTTSPPSPAMTGESFSVNAVSSTGFHVEYESATPSVCSTNYYEIYMAAGGMCTIVASARGDEEYEEGRAEQTFQVLKEQQHISLSPPPRSARVGEAPYAFSAEARSGLPVSLSIATPAVCKFENGRAEVAFVSPGTCTIDANQEGDSYWEAAPQVEQSFQVSKALQQLSFQTLQPSNIMLGEGPFPVVAISSSGLPVKLSSATPSTCSFETAEVHVIAAGACTIDANQSGSAYFEEAPQIEDSFTIAKRAQIVRFLSNAPASATAGGTPYLATAEASSGLPVSISTGGAGVCEANGRTIYFLGAGTCVLDASQEGNAEFAAALVARQSIAVLAAPIAQEVFSNPLSPLIRSTADSHFHLLHAPTVNQTSGAITFSASVTQAGTFSWVLAFKAGSASRCRGERERLRAACHRRLTFGTGTLAVDSTEASSGIVSFKVLPSGAAKSALHKALRMRHALGLTASISFQSSLGGAPFTHRYSVADRLRSKRQPAGKLASEVPKAAAESATLTCGRAPAPVQAYGAPIHQSSTDICPPGSPANWFALTSAGSIGLDLRRIRGNVLIGGRTAPHGDRRSISGLMPRSAAAHVPCR
jgi:hypothetical protein